MCFAFLSDDVGNTALKILPLVTHNLHYIAKEEDVVTACFLQFLSGVSSPIPEGSRVDRHQTFKALIMRNRLVVVGEGGAEAFTLRNGITHVC